MLYTIYAEATGLPIESTTNPPALRDLPEGCAVWEGLIPAGHKLDRETMEIVEAIKPRDEALREALAQRDGLLASTDKYMIPDYPISDEQRAAWATYRANLRDLGSVLRIASNPETIIFPAAPGTE